MVTVTSIFCAYGLFIFFSWSSILEFQEGKTGFNQVLMPVQELPLPAITVCSKSVFKNVDNETFKEEILKNLSNHVFSWEEVFHASFLEKLHMWNPHEIFNPRLGVCFSIKFEKNVTTMKKEYLNFHKGLNNQASFFPVLNFRNQYLDMELFFNLMMMTVHT